MDVCHVRLRLQLHPRGRDGHGENRAGAVLPRVHFLNLADFDRQAISLISRIGRMNGDPILVIAPLAVLKGWEEVRFVDYFNKLE
jgi:hypothetical protein